MTDYFKSKNILIISNEGWGELWYSKHNYAYELSKSNNVFFINPTSKWRFINLFKHTVEIAPTNYKNIQTVSYSNVLPLRLKFLFKINEFIIHKKIKNKLKKSGYIPEILITFDPYRLVYPHWFAVDKSIFICVDDYEFEFIGERILPKNIQAIVSISKTISDKYLVFKKPILLTSHGISSDEFASVNPYLGHVNFGLYIGSFDNRVDFELVRLLLSKFKDVDFLFIGKAIANGEKYIEQFSKEFSNFIYLGVKPFKELKNYIDRSKFCLAPMSNEFPGNIISHHKIFQYLAFGKPTFSTEFSEYHSIKHLLYMENNHAKFLKNVADFIEHGEKNELAKERITFAKTKTYETILNDINSFLQEIS